VDCPRRPNRVEMILVFFFFLGGDRGLLACWSAQALNLSGHGSERPIVPSWLIAPSKRGVPHQRASGWSDGRQEEKKKHRRPGRGLRLVCAYSVAQRDATNKRLLNLLGLLSAWCCLAPSLCLWAKTVKGAMTPGGCRATTQCQMKALCTRCKLPSPAG
jgi:hypothetical protein